MVEVKGSSFIRLLNDFNVNPCDIAKILNINMVDVVNICKSDFIRVPSEYVDILCSNFHVNENYFLHRV